MNDKQIYDLSRDDIRRYPVWYFPMDETVEDELTVRPIKANEKLPDGDYQVIVRTMFEGSDGQEYIGYLYWSDPPEISDIKPVVFTGDEDCVTFWNGMCEPSWNDYSSEQQALKNAFPLKYRSEAYDSLAVIFGELDGLYYLDDKGVTKS